MSAVCEDSGLSVEGCAHCRGLTAVNLDSAHLPPDPLPEPPQAPVVVRGRRGGKVALQGLARLLQDTAQLYLDLEDALHGTRTGDPGARTSGGGSGDEKPLPLSAEVAEHRHLLLRGLRYWAAKVHATPRVLAVGGVSHLTAWLVSELHTLDAEQQTELRGNLLDWQRGASGRMDLPKLRGSIPLGTGTCPGGTEGVWTCPGELRLMVPADRGKAPWLQCGGCRSRYTVTELPKAANVRLPVHDAAELLGVSVRTVQRRTERDSGYVRLGDVLRSECAL